MGKSSRFQKKIAFKNAIKTKSAHGTLTSSYPILSTISKNSSIQNLSILLAELFPNGKIYDNLDYRENWMKINDFRDEIDPEEDFDELFGNRIGLTKLDLPFLSDPEKTRMIRILQAKFKSKTISKENLVILAQFYLQLRSTSKYLTIHRYISKKYPQDRILIYLQGLKLLLVERKFDLALVKLQKAHDAGVKGEFIELYLGNVYNNLGDFIKAENYYNNAVKHNENYSEAWYNLAVINYNHKKDLLRSEEYFLRSLYANPLYYNGWYGLYIFLKQNLSSLSEWDEDDNPTILIVFLLLFAPYHGRIDEILPDSELTIYEIKYIFSLSNAQREGLKSYYLDIWAKLKVKYKDYLTFFDHRKEIYHEFSYFGEIISNVFTKIISHPRLRLKEDIF